MDRSADTWPRPRWGWRGGEADAIAGPAFRLDQALRRLQQAAADPPSGGDDLSARGLTGILQPPASSDAIGEAELRLGTALPADYTRLLFHSNGVVLVHSSAPEQCSIELFGTAELVRCAEEMEGDYHGCCIPELLIFAAVGTEGDHLAFQTGRMNPDRGCAVLDARRQYRPDQWWVIAPDFTDWLERVLKERGLPGSFGRQWEPMAPQPPLPWTNPLPSIE